MAKKAYIGVDGKARKVKKIYVGVGGVARKVKKAYIGVGGVARPCFTGGELAYYGTATALSLARTDVCGGSIGDYALFVGGYDTDSSERVNTVDIYNQSLTRTVSTITNDSYIIQSANVGDYVLFGGGSGASGAVEAYNSSLTRTSATALAAPRFHHAATSVGNYALFGGGYTSSPIKTVEVYDGSLTRSSATSLTNSASHVSATSVGSYALFGGGCGSSTTGYLARSNVDVYNASLTKSTATALSTARGAMHAVSNGTYALFAGGYYRYSSTSALVRYATVDTYNSSLTKSTAASLSVDDSCDSVPNSVCLGDYILIHNAIARAMNIYDASLTMTLNEDGTALKCGEGGTAVVGNYAIFAGGLLLGDTGEAATNIVDVYTVG